jgi:hypothetical protein
VAEAAGEAHGLRPKLAARLLAIAGILVGFLDELLPLVSGQHWTSLTSKLVDSSRACCDQSGLYPQ